LETFTTLKSFVDNPDFPDQRRKKLKTLDFDSIDKPIRGLIGEISELDYCFTLQSCFGHFVYENQKDSHNTSPLPTSPIPGEIEYRIAYIALCLQNNENGETLFAKLKEIRSIDKQYIQFGCADWFWDQQVNSYALQVEPERFKYHDKIDIEYEEALHIEDVRNSFFIGIRNVLSDVS
jgi:hypothetical protein